MRAVNFRVPILLAILTAACNSTPRPVPVTGGRADIARLAGEWSGSYTSPEKGRDGTIVFKLTAQEDTAIGDVLMVPRGWNRPLGPALGPERADRSNPEVLTIQFVEVAGGSVRGTLAPYRDPECGCTLITTFWGHLRDDVIEGTFTTRTLHTNAEFRGRWQVSRKPNKSGG